MLLTAVHIDDNEITNDSVISHVLSYSLQLEDCMGRAHHGRGRVDLLF